MYKLFKIKHIACLLLLILTVLFSCDGRERANRNNAEILKQHNLLKDFSQRIVYTPNVYTEIYTDTLLSNNLRVKLKYYSLLQDSVVKHITKNNLDITHYYNNFEAILNVSNGEKAILSTIINKSLFKDFENDIFWKEAIMQSLWLDYESITSQSININVSFCIAESSICKDYTLVIDNLGDIIIQENNLSQINI